MSLPCSAHPGMCDSVQLGQAHSDQHPEAIVAVRNFEPFVTEYTGATTTKNLEQWIAEQR